MSTFPVRRLDVRVPSVTDFRRSYEAALPRVPVGDLIALVQREAPWSEVTALIDSATPHGFMLFEANDARPIMRLARNSDAPCFWYLMGNHLFAEIGLAAGSCNDQTRAERNDERRDLAH